MQTSLQIVGVDFTSAPRRAKPITVAHGKYAGNLLRIDRIDSHADWLDAVLCAVAAAWAVQRPCYGLPTEIDPVEGWIAGAMHAETGVP